MVENGELPRLQRHSARSEPTLADLLDPMALEQRLRQARARRAAALALEQRKRQARARRAAARAGTKPAGEDVLPAPGPLMAPAGLRAEAPARLPTPLPVITLVWPPRPEAVTRRRNRHLVGLFLAGLCLGAIAAVMLAPAPMRSRVADLIAPEAASELLTSIVEPPAAAPNARPDPGAPAPASTRTAPAPQVPAADAPPSATAALPAGPPTVSLVARSAGPAASNPAPRPGAPAPAAAAAAPPAEMPVPAADAAAAVVAALPAGPPAVAGVASSAGSAETVTTLAAPPAATGPSRSPVPTGLAVPSSEPPPPAAAPAVDTAPAGAVDQGRPALAVRVMLHYPPSARDATDAAIAALEAAGVTEVMAVPVIFEVSRTDVRFFHGTDRAAADGVASVLERGTAGPAPQARDFTHFSPQPASGELEVWLAGVTGYRCPQAAC